MHEITRNLERLSPKLSAHEDVTFIVFAQHKVTFAGTIHGFGVIVDVVGRNGVLPIAGVSDTARSTQPRGALAGVLTALEWIGLNCDNGCGIRVLSSNDYVYKHLPIQLDKWIANPKQPNIDLLTKISDRWNRRNGNIFGRVDRSDKRYIRASQLAADAIEHVVEQNHDFEDGISTIDDTDWLMRRAIERDRTGE